MWTTTIVLALCALVQAEPEKGGSGATGSTEGIHTSAYPSVTIESTDPARVVYLSHVGAYWTIGPVISRVREYMREQGEPGPLYVRFPMDPSTSLGASAPCEVGFFTARNYTVSAPFKSETRGDEMVASMYPDRSLESPVRYYSFLRNWAEAHGHASTGPVTEIHRVSPGGSRGDARMQVRLAVRAMPKTLYDRTPNGGSSGNRQVSNPHPDQSLASRIQLNEGVPAIQASTGPAGGPTGDETAIGVVASADVAPSNDSVRTLIQQGRYEEIAEQLMPGGKTFSPSAQLWLGQVVFRLGAAAGGLERVYPDANTAIPVLSESIRRRYEHFALDFTGDPRSHAVPVVGPAGTTQAEERAAIMHDLDAILGGIAVKRFDAETVEAQLADIVERIRDLFVSVDASR